MSKVKNKKSNLINNYIKMKKQSMKKIPTPFEIHLNKNKQNILGRKNKADQGLPGIARTKAIMKRKNTLLLEYKIKDKNNIFLDRRIGEKSSSMTEEDKAMVRFAEEKIKAHNKKNIFNLNNEEVLTHKGQNLIDIEKYDNPRSDEDDYSDNENKTGKLDKKFVEDVHFGGGILSKSNVEICRKDLIDQLIAESKKRKAERQKIREQTVDLTEKLDSEWHDLLPLVSSCNKGIESIEKKQKNDDYDIALKKLKYEKRAMPTDKLKSDEVIAKEEKLVLKYLEENRLIRMKGFSDAIDVVTKHKSADDLDDFKIEKIKNDEKNNINNNSEESSNCESNKDNDESEDELNNNFFDLKLSKFSNSENNLKENIAKIINISKKKNENDNLKCDIEGKSEKNQPKSLYTFKIPSRYEELLTLIKNYNPNHQSIIIEKIIKYNNGKLVNENKEKLSNLFSLLLQYLNECAFVKNSKELIKFFQIFNKLCPQLYDLIHANPDTTKNCLNDILTNKYSNFKNNMKIYPKLDTLILFKLVSILYPTSDFRHPIVTPCLVFMSQILFRCKIKGKHDISKGLFLCTLILEYTILSKRWTPSVINFLRGIIFISLPKPFSKFIKVLPPFKINKKNNLLVLERNQRNMDVDPTTIRMQIEDLSTEKINDDYRLRTFITALNLLCEFKEQYKELDAAYSIFEPILILLKYGSIKKYPKKIKKKVEIFIHDIEKLKNKNLEYLVFDKKRPKALKMYEPRIEDVQKSKKHKPMSKAKAEREKLLHKLKKETKSAIREVRRDNIFLSKIKLKQQIACDVERKRKVKEIIVDAAIQQSELKKLRKK